MVSRLVTALFWALAFFALGAWSGGSLRPIGAALTDAAGSAIRTATDYWYDTPHDPAPAAPPIDPMAAAVLSATGPADLTEARTAFARGDLAGAIRAYQAAAQAHPGDAAALGELGNVYFTSGQTENAARAWTAAGLLLVAAGEDARARALVPAIRSYDPALAARLDASLIAKELNTVPLP